MATLACMPRFTVCLDCRALLVSGGDYCPACGALLWERNLEDMPPFLDEQGPLPELMR